ncbi:hypothetical protein F5X99DRAFT_432244 [Biscogniauxia marginata]|nr:hypothetical protein F5X99DRAFT_432244 [Biscogniauxia marginata]
MADQSELRRHLAYLQRSVDEDEANEAASSPIFTSSVRTHKPLFPQSALLACEVDDYANIGDNIDTRIFYNVAAPSSMFICGSQGSGKSHTLSCILESCLIPSEVSDLPRPLTGILFHYDTFISDRGGAPCEAAFLASNPNASVRVLCPPTNFRAIQESYRTIPGVTVEMLQLNEFDLNTQRMLDLMAVGDGTLPLYLHVVQRILREMRLEQQAQPNKFSFNYADFKRRIEAQSLTGQQSSPLQQRLDTLESFMVKKHNVSGARDLSGGKQKKKNTTPMGTDWKPVAGQLTIVDLSCPCVTPEMACSLFNICLSLFLEQEDPQQQNPGPSSSSSSSPPIGRIVALDEAHKYMATDETSSSAECRTLTNTLLSTIRLQRHLGVRVVVSTQEPSVSPKLLDLCSVTVVHRFTSPAWMGMLRAHLAGGVPHHHHHHHQQQQRRREIAGGGGDDDDGYVEEGDDSVSGDLFNEIVGLRVGEALLFAPSALVGLGMEGGEGGEGGDASKRATGMSLKRLGDEVLKIRVRKRITVDGGKSILAA